MQAQAEFLSEENEYGTHNIYDEIVNVSNSTRSKCFSCISSLLPLKPKLSVVIHLVVLRARIECLLKSADFRLQSKTERVHPQRNRKEETRCNVVKQSKKAERLPSRYSCLNRVSLKIRCCWLLEKKTECVHPQRNRKQETRCRVKQSKKTKRLVSFFVPESCFSLSQLFTVYDCLHQK